MTATIFAGGAWIFAIVLVVMFLAVAHGLYSLSGSAINRHPFHQSPSDAPGAFLPDEMSDFETFETQILHRRPHPSRPVPSHR